MHSANRSRNYKPLNLKIMMPQENYDNYNQDDRNYNMNEEFINSEIVENTDSTINQYLDDKRSADHQPTELDHDDADRRTLDESEADEDEDDE